MKDFPKVEVTSRQQWRDWLMENHARRESIWLVTYKKAAGNRYLPYDAIVEEALCFGWVDSLPRALDAERTMLLLSPRQPKSAWSKLNKDRVAKMVAAGLMHPAGLKKIEQAKQDGAWYFLDDVEALVVPDDLQAALNQYPNAAQHFEAFPPSTKRGILEWIKLAKRAATRAKRIAETARLAEENIRANQPKKR
ncbi:MAG: YdeI/OmpD-associated family protein [Cyanobacteria bacterium P01_A01_bin.114]